MGCMQASTGLTRPPAEGTRRERLRQSTVAEIKARAWRQVADGGATSVSLRAIARDMGMTSSALYRYFDSREQLVEELVADGYASLADTLESAIAAEGWEHDPLGRFFHVVHTYRAWALAHSTEYGLVFGTSICGPDVNERVLQEHHRGVQVLFQVMIDGIATGCVDPRRIGPLTAVLDAQLQRWQQELGLPLESEALAACLYVYAQLHGTISIELFQGLPDALMPAEQLFEFQMRTIMTTLGATA